MRDAAAFLSVRYHLPYNYIIAHFCEFVKGFLAFFYYFYMLRFNVQKKDSPRRDCPPLSPIDHAVSRDDAAYPVYFQPTIILICQYGAECDIPKCAVYFRFAHIIILE